MKPSFFWVPPLGWGLWRHFCTGSSFNSQHNFGRLIILFSFLQSGKLEIRERTCNLPQFPVWEAESKARLPDSKAANSPCIAPPIFNQARFISIWKIFFISLSVMCWTYIWQLFNFSVLTFTFFLNRISVSILRIKFFMMDSFLHTSHKIYIILVSEHYWGPFGLKVWQEWICRKQCRFFFYQKRERDSEAMLK